MSSSEGEEQTLSETDVSDEGEDSVGEVEPVDRVESEYQSAQ